MERDDRARGRLGCIATLPGTPTRSLTDDAGFGCLDGGTGTSFVGYVFPIYWSRSANEAAPGNAWRVEIEFGLLNFFSKFSGLGVWPVREADPASNSLCR